MLHLRSTLVKAQEYGCIAPGFSNPQSRVELSKGACEESGWPARIQKLQTKLCIVVYPD